MTITRTRPGFAPYKPIDEEQNRRTLQSMRKGQLNNGGEVTLTANSATTTLSDPLITRNSVVHFGPMTNNAKTEGIPYYHPATDLNEGQVVLHHNNNAQTDRSYMYTVNC